MASVKVLEIVNIFTQAPMELSILEDCEKISISFGLQKDNMLLTENAPIGLLSDRDKLTIRWHQMDSDEFDNIDYLSGSGNWKEFKKEYDEETVNSELLVDITIDKNLINHCLSVYDVESFNTTLLQKGTFAFLCSINSVFEDFLYFEVLDKTFQSWHTQSIAFYANGKGFKLDEDYCKKIDRNQKNHHGKIYVMLKVLME